MLPLVHNTLNENEIEFTGKGEEKGAKEERSSGVRKQQEDGGRGSLILEIGYLAGLGREEKTGILGGGGGIAA